MNGLTASSSNFKIMVASFQENFRTQQRLFRETWEFADLTAYAAVQGTVPLVQFSNPEFYQKIYAVEEQFLDKIVKIIKTFEFYNNLSMHSTKGDNDLSLRRSKILLTEVSRVEKKALSIYNKVLKIFREKFESFKAYAEDGFVRSNLNKILDVINTSAVNKVYMIFSRINRELTCLIRKTAPLKPKKRKSQNISSSDPSTISSSTALVKRVGDRAIRFNSEVKISLFHWGESVLLLKESPRQKVADLIEGKDNRGKAPRKEESEKQGYRELLKKPFKKSLLT